MRKFGLIGYPLGHSFSKKYFAEKFSRENIVECSYENYQMESLNCFREMVTGDDELCGLNVTIPYKTEILRYIDVSEPSMMTIGAANVLKFRRQTGKVQIYGFNSDVTGIRESVRLYFRDNAGNALILGTGGSSRAVVYTLKNMGFSVTLVSRTQREGVITYRDLDSSILEKTDLIVNTTPLGMYPGIHSKPDINYSLLNDRHILFDLVYNPEMTEFLSKGKEQGCRIITGLKMLYIQAERSWEIWNDPNL